MVEIDGVFRLRQESVTHGFLTAREQTLLGRVAAGDAAAVRACIAEHGPLVWSVARRFSASSAEAEDAAQDIFIELWKHAGRFDPGQASERTFVAMIARRRMIDRLRAAQRRPALKPMPEAMAGDEHATLERSAEAMLAASALATLDPKQRRVLSLAIGQGMTHGEIAEALSMPLGTVKSLVRRALVAVRKRLLAERANTRGDAS